MECLFPGSSTAPRRFAVEVTELAPGTSSTLCGVAVRAWEADHPSGAPALLLRLDLAGKVIAYSGDTEWTDTLPELARGADLFVCECNFFDTKAPGHLDYETLMQHRSELECERIVITHMSDEMLGRLNAVELETASDGAVISV